MPKDDVLPVVGHERALSFDELIYEAAVAQRAADLVILERDYVPKERVKLLVKALEEIATGRVVSEKCLLGVVYKELAYAPLFARVEIAQQALAGLGVEVKHGQG